MRGEGSQAQLTFTEQFLVSMFYVAAKECSDPDAMLEFARSCAQRAQYERAQVWLRRYQGHVRRGGVPAIDGRLVYVPELLEICRKALEARATGAPFILGWSSGDGSSVFVDRTRGVFGDAAARVVDRADAVTATLSQVVSSDGSAEDPSTILEDALRSAEVVSSDGSAEDPSTILEDALQRVTCDDADDDTHK